MARRSTRRHHPILLAIGIIALALIVIHVIGVLPLLVISAAGGGCYWARLRRRPVAKARITKPRSAPAMLNRQPRPVKQPGRPGDARARANGWMPPATAKLLMVAITPECAGDEHLFCVGTGCGCPCSHDSKIIVAMNSARADAEAVPF